MRSAQGHPVDYQWADIRYSISWKAYCFSDAAERSTWETGNDDLTIDEILDTLELELRNRGVMQGPRPEPNAFALMLVQTFIQYPGS
jgi:hypothetical protein